MQSPSEKGSRDQHRQTRAGRDRTRGNSGIKKTASRICSHGEGEAPQAKVGCKDAPAKPVFGM